MPKAGQAQDEAMDEILASIRRIIQDEDVRKSSVRAAATTRAGANPDEPAGAPAGNVSRLVFGDADEVEIVESNEPKAGARAPEDGNVVELAIAQAMESAGTDLEADDASAETPVRRSDAGPRRPVEARPVPPTAAPARVPPAQPLMSPRADAAVAGAFQHLSASMLAGSARTIDELVEDMLRPMLRNWLDTNLPPLVERLVREEIERVSRGRR